MVSAPQGTAAFFEEVEPITFVEGDAVIARFQIVPAVPRDEVEANPNLALDIEIAEFAFRRPKGAKWLWLPLGNRLLGMDAFIEATIGRFERDCVGFTRSKYVADEIDLDGPAV